MSILLEALRKTEKNQKQQQVPTIHTQEPSRPDPEPLKTGPLVAMIAVALVVSGWFTWRQYQIPEGVYMPPVTLEAGQVRETASTTPTAESPVKATPDPVGKKPAPARSNAPGKGTSKPARTPVESFQASKSSEGSGQANTKQGNSAANKPVSNVGSSVTSGSKSGTGRPTETTTNQRTSKPAKEDTAHVPAPIDYWELPDAVRAGVSEIHFSVLVYNKDPAQRFVLIDGQRLAEGDEAQPGVRVEEIRRDGVIFRYRLYNFLVSR